MSDAARGSILITGANGGLGSAIVKAIAGSPELSRHHGIYTVRNVDTATTLNASLPQANTTHEYDVMALDLSKLANVRSVAARINQRVTEGSLPPIRALVLNAAFQEQTTQTFTADGYDMTFQSNYLSHWLLTLLLLRSMDREYGRIIVISSCGHDPYDIRQAPMGIFEEEHWKTVFNGTDTLAKGTWSSPKEDLTYLGGMRRYCASKTCLVMMMHELQRRLNKDPLLSNICVLGLDPGGMPTGILRRGNFLLSVLLTKVYLPLAVAISSLLSSSPNGLHRSTAKSAGDVLRAAFDVETLGSRPRAVYLNGTEAWESSAESRDEGKQQQLWLDSVTLTCLDPADTLLSEVGSS